MVAGIPRRKSGRLRRLRAGAAGLLLVFLAGRPGWAQFEFEEEFLEAGEWVFSATKRAQPVEEAPAAISIITAEEIRNSGATNLGDLLRRVPGLEVIAFSPSDYEIGARGQNKTLQNGVLVLVNGRSIYQDAFGIVLWNLTDFPLEQISKIEVVRGPGSVLYGANAFHAVVNIITKTPFEASGSLVSLTGGPDLLVGTLMEGGRKGRLGHLVSTGWTQFSSFGDPEDIVLQYPRGRVFLTYDLERAGEIQFEAGVEGGDHEAVYDATGMMKIFSVSHNLMAEYRRPNFYFRTFWNSINADRIYVPELLFGSGLVLKGLSVPVGPREDWEFEVELEDHVLDFEAQQILEWRRDNLFTLGASYRYHTLDCTMIERYDTQSLLAAYLQHEFIFRKYLHSYLGLRWDQHPVTGSNLSPRGSLLVSPRSGHTFRFSGGRSFRNPTLVETLGIVKIPLQVETDPPTPLEINFTGNQGLEPEELVSYEIGYRSSLFRGRFQFDFNLFFNQIRGLVWPLFDVDVVQMFTEGTFHASFDNSMDEEVKGIEIEVKARPYSWLSGFANYSFNDVNITRVKVRGESGVEFKDVDDVDYFAEPVDGHDPKQDERTPRHKVNAGITAEPGYGISATALLHFVDQTYWPPSLDRELEVFKLGPLGSYTLLNLRLAYRFYRDQAELAFMVFNLLGDEHREYPLAGQVDEIGRRYYGSVRVSF